MAKPRKTLQMLLEEVSGFDSQHVIFQPGPNATMDYPCIVYQRDDASTNHADNLVYSWAQRYQVTLIDRQPDSDVFDKIIAMRLCAFERHFATSGLNHDVFVIYH